MRTVTFRYHLAAVLGLGLLLGAAFQAQAQAADPGSGGPTPTPATQVPIDGGASLLLAGGVAYGLRRLQQRRQR